MMVFVATSLYVSAMWVEISVYPVIETGFVFKPHEQCSCKSIQRSNF